MRKLALRKARLALWSGSKSEHCEWNLTVTRERQNCDVGGWIAWLYGTRGEIQSGLASSDLFFTVTQASPQNLIEFG